MERFPGTMGMVHTGLGYDTVKLLAGVWARVDPSDFDAVGQAIKAVKYRGTCDLHTFANDTNSGTSCPNQTDDPEAGQAHLIFQVQDGAHTIIPPKPFNQAELRPVPWAKAAAMPNQNDIFGCRGTGISFGGRAILTDVSYQRPYRLTCAHWRSVIEVTVLGSSAKRFHARQQASAMAG